MKKSLSMIMALVLIASALFMFAGCGEVPEELMAPAATDSTESAGTQTETAEGELVSDLKAVLVGSVTDANYVSLTAGGGYYEDENGLYSVMSLNGYYNTGGKYAALGTTTHFFQVSTTIPKDASDIAGINSVALIDGTGREIIPAIYAGYQECSERYVKAYEATAQVANEDDALISFDDDEFMTAPSSEEVYYKGKWYIYDTVTGKKVSGATGTTNVTATAYGDILNYYDDNNNRVIVNPDGVVLDNSVTLFHNGTYAAEDRSGAVYNSDGSTLFSYDLAGYIPSYYESGYYRASKYEDGTTTYVVMDQTGAVVSAEFDKSFTIYGKFIDCDGKLYNFDGENIYSGTYSYIVYDELFGKAWTLVNSDTDKYTIINENAEVIFEDYTSDLVTVYSSDFCATKKIDGDYTAYIYADGDYTVEGYPVAPWIVEAKSANSVSDLVDAISGEKLLETYKSYSVKVVDDEAMYVYASYNGGIDIYQVISGDQVVNVEATKEDLLSELVAAFEAEGINVTVDQETGELAMDASVLFGGDSAELTDEGKSFLSKFIKAYTSIVFSDKYKDFVTCTMVEGHIAPVGGVSFESGLPLSEERAENVKAYCLSVDTGVDSAELDKALKTIGYSNSKPVYDSNGNVDMDASRRVSFRFLINVEE